MELANLIRSERLKLGWSQRELAKRARVSPAAVAQWESGDTKPTRENLLELFGLFGISPEALFDPGGEYYGQFVENADEVALLALWRQLDPEERKYVLRLVRGAALAADGEAKDRKKS